MYLSSCATALLEKEIIFVNKNTVFVEGVVIVIPFKANFLPGRLSSFVGVQRCASCGMTADE